MVGNVYFIIIENEIDPQNDVTVRVDNIDKSDETFHDTHDKKIFTYILCGYNIFLQKGIDTRNSYDIHYILRIRDQLNRTSKNIISNLKIDLTASRSMRCLTHFISVF